MAIRGEAILAPLLSLPVYAAGKRRRRYILRHDEPADRWEIVVVTREP